MFSAIICSVVWTKLLVTPILWVVKNWINLGAAVRRINVIYKIEKRFSFLINSFLTPPHTHTLVIAFKIKNNHTHKIGVIITNSLVQTTEHIIVKQ